MGVRTLSGSTGVRYNSAHSPGCPCCPLHGDECPGSPAKGHRPLPGQKPCEGRCVTGFQKCPLAHSSFEEFAVANTERIFDIEIVDGPAGLIGYGSQFFNAPQAVRDAAYQAKVQEFYEWEVAHPEIVMDVRHDAAAWAAYEASLAKARLQFAALGPDGAAEAARAQFDDPEVGGVKVASNPFEENNGIYALAGTSDDGWPYLQSIKGSPYLFHRPAGNDPEWGISKYFDPTGNPNPPGLRVPCNCGRLPLGVQQWMGAKKPRGLKR